MSKSYQKKKDYRLMIKLEARKGLINNADGKMVKRDNSVSSMHQNYYPQH